LVVLQVTAGVGRQRRGRRSRSTGFVAFIGGGAWSNAPPLFQHCSRRLPSAVMDFLGVYFVIF
jgi:hypothetical protein